MIKKYYKCSLELEDGRLVELRMCNHITPATKHHPEESRAFHPLVCIDNVFCPRAELLKDEQEAVDFLMEQDTWTEWYPIFEKQGCD